MQSDEHQSRDPWTKRNAIAGFVVIPLVILGALFSAGVFSGGSSTRSGTSSHTTPSTGATGAGSGVGEPESGATTKYVESLQTTTNKSVAFGGANVGGRNYPHGVTINSLSSTVEEPNGVAVALPGQFSAFRAVVGVEPNTAPGFSGSMGVKVATGEHDLFTTTISRGSVPCTMNVSLKGAGNLELRVYFQSGEPLKVAFGEARVVGSKDFANMPSGPPCS